MLLPKITIVTPSFNQGSFIEKTILSVINQDYPAIEFIIIDGGSTDNTLDIIRKYGDHITYWVSEEDGGQANAINKGLQRATGELFNWLNSDDYLEPGALKAIGEAYLADPGKKIFCGYTHCFYQQSGETSHTYRMGTRPTVSETILHVEMNQPGSFYSTAAVRELGNLNESLHYVFDGELWFRFLCRYGLEAVGHTSKMIAHFRLHQSSKSVEKGYFEFYKEYLNIHLFLAKELGLPARMVHYLQEEQYIDRYRPGKWDLRKLEKNTLYNLFSDKYKYRLYQDYEYNHARKGLWHSLLRGKGEALRPRLALALKLLLPGFMINGIRSVKQSLL